MKAKDWKGALEHYEQAIGQSPRAARLHSKMSELFITLGREDDARVASEKTLALDPEDGRALGVWAWTHGTTDHAKAFEHAERAVARAPENAFAWHCYGNFLYQNGEWDKALAAQDRSIQLCPNDSLALYDRATTQQKRGDLARARADLDASIELRPEWFGLRDRAVLRVKANDGDGALADAEWAFALQPDDSRVRRLVEQLREAVIPDGSPERQGDEDFPAGRMVEALARYETALQHSDVGRLHRKKAEALNALSRFPEAEAEANAAIERDGKDGKAFAARAWARGAIGKGDEALADLEKALQLDPRNALAWHNLANGMRDRGRFDEALEAFDKCFALAPGAALAWYDRGVLWMRQGNYARARDDFDGAIARAPAFNAYRERARAREALGDHPGAVADAEEAVRRAPGDAECRTLLERLRAR
jgi:tetratricopeptide (TPR) repeat protein